MASQTDGPCAVCRETTHRYGMGGNPLCETCAQKLARNNRKPRSQRD